MGYAPSFHKEFKHPESEYFLYETHAENYKEKLERMGYNGSVTIDQLKLNVGGQSQEATLDQVKELVSIANTLGLYDAADSIKSMLKI